MVMSERPLFPPIYEPIRLPDNADGFAIALQKAREGAGAATLCWVPRRDRVDMAIILEPEKSLREALGVIHVAMVAIADAAGAVIPPQVAVTFGWPDRILLNAALVGGLKVQASHGPDALDRVPDWLVIGIELEVMTDFSDPNPGRRKLQTTFHDEGCAEIDALDLIDSIARHFLTWINTWMTEGARPVYSHWLERAEGYREAVTIRLGGKKRSGTLSGLDEDGSLILTRDGKVAHLPLKEVLGRPTWQLSRSARSMQKRS